MGLLGVLNGLCGTYDNGSRKGWGAVSVLFGEDGEVRIAATLSENTGERG